MLAQARSSVPSIEKCAFDRSAATSGRANVLASAPGTQRLAKGHGPDLGAAVPSANIAIAGTMRSVQARSMELLPADSLLTPSATRVQITPESK